MLHNRQLISELEYQYKLIESLIEKKNSLQINVLNLKTEIKTHSELHEFLKEKNQEAEECFRKFSSKKVKFHVIEKEESIENIETVFSNKNITVKTSNTINTNDENVSYSIKKNKASLLKLTDIKMIVLEKKIKLL